MRIVRLFPLILLGLGCDTSSATKVTGAIGVDCTAHGIVVSPATVSMFVGDSAQLAATTPQPPCGTGSPVFWQSSNLAVVTVDSASGKVRAVASGQATVLAVETNDTAVKGAAAVTVNSR